MHSEGNYSSAAQRDPKRQIDMISKDLRDVEIRRAWAVAGKDEAKVERLDTLRDGLMRDLTYWKSRSKRVINRD